MIRLLRWLLFGHVHEWEHYETIKEKTDGIYTGAIYVLRCKRCGDIKTKRVA